MLLLRYSAPLILGFILLAGATVAHGDEGREKGEEGFAREKKHLEDEDLDRKESSGRWEDKRGRTLDSASQGKRNTREKDDMKEKNAREKKNGKRSSTQGVVGVVEDIGSSTLTLKAQNGTVYTVDTSSSSVRTRSAAATLTDITVGERVAVHGTFASTTILAKTIMENIPDVPLARGETQGLLKKALHFFGASSTVSTSASTTHSKKRGNREEDFLKRIFRGWF
jgi:hypothetical protein